MPYLAAWPHSSAALYCVATDWSTFLSFSVFIFLFDVVATKSKDVSKQQKRACYMLHGNKSRDTNCSLFEGTI